MITTHPAYPRLKELAEKQKKNIHEGEFAYASNICSSLLNDFA